MYSWFRGFVGYSLVHRFECLDFYLFCFFNVHCFNFRTIFCFNLVVSAFNSTFHIFYSIVFDLLCLWISSQNLKQQVWGSNYLRGFKLLPLLKLQCWCSGQNNFSMNCSCCCSKRRMRNLIDDECFLSSWTTAKITNHRSMRSKSPLRKRLFFFEKDKHIFQKIGLQF